MKLGSSASPWKSLPGALDGLVSVLFPAPCRVYGQPLPTASRLPVYPECLAALRRIEPALCRACGRPFPPLVTLSEPVCHACAREVHRFDLARSFAHYDAPAERVLLLLKYDPVTPLAPWFAARREEAGRTEPALAEVDWIVPVPLARSPGASIARSPPTCSAACVPALGN